VSERTPFVVECQRLMTARRAATTATERDDAEWALTYVMQMQRTGRLDEYFANQQAVRDQREAT
jgi:hypothetical protein